MPDVINLLCVLCNCLRRSMPINYYCNSCIHSFYALIYSLSVQAFVMSLLIHPFICVLMNLCIYLLICLFVSSPNPLLQEYAEDQEKFFVDFSAAFIKLSELNAQWK